MALDPNKLSALIEEQAANPLGAVDMEDADSEEEGGGEGGDMLARGEELLVSMGEFGDELRESADIMVDNAAEAAGDELVVEDTVDRMPDHIVGGMAENLEGKPREDLDAVGAVLVASTETEESPEGEYSEGEAANLGEYLELAASCCAGLDDDDEEEDEEEDEDEDSEDDMDDEDMEGEGNPY